MSDENGDASGEGWLAPGGDGSTEPIDPALADRLDTIHRTLSTVGMRIDALVTSTTTYRTALTDRLTEYSDLVAKLTRAQGADLEEYQRTNERTVADLRRGLASSEEILQRLEERIEAMQGGPGSPAAGSDEVVEEIRSVLDLQHTLTRSLTESLDQFGDRVLARIAATQAATEEQLEEIRASLADDTRTSRIDGQLAGLQSAIGLLATAEQVGRLTADVRAQLIDIVGLGDGTVVSQLQRIEQQLSTSQQASSGPPAAADGPDASDLADLRAKVDAILDASGDETMAVSRLLDEVRETLLDVASGEVLGALWDEFRGARASLDEVLGAVERTEDAARAAVDAAGRAPDATASDPGLESLRADVTALTAAVHDLLQQAEVVEEPPAPAVDDGMLAAVADDLQSLRSELSRGLVVEPSDALAGAVDQLRTDVAALDGRLGAIDDLRGSFEELRAVTERAAPPAPPAEPDERTLDELRSVRDDVTTLGERLDTIAALQQAVTALRDDVRAASASAAEPVPASMSEDLEGELATLRTGVDAVSGELRAVRSGIEDVIARLDEGLVLADDIVAPASASAPEVDDQLASLRDQVTTEFDALRRLLASQADTADGERAGADVDLSAVTERLDALAERLADQQRSLQLAPQTGSDAQAPAPVAEVDLTPVTELLEHVRDDLADLPARLETSRPEPVAPAVAEPAYATVDPDVVDLLREEIRAAGAVPDDLLDQLRKELVALRRRIKLRAEGEVLTDDQLDAIADAVARKLAE